MQRLFITIPTSTILVDGVAYITTEPTRTDTDGNTTLARNGGCDPIY